MEYGIIINNGQTYSHAARESDRFGTFNWQAGAVPRNGCAGIIKQWSEIGAVRAATIAIDGQDYIVGGTGIQLCSLEEYNNAKNQENNMATTTAVRKSPVRPMTNITHEKYQVGDLIQITASGNAHYGKILRVTDPSYPGYDIVTGRDAQDKNKAYGFKFPEFKRYIPEPEIAPDDKPQFSKNEILFIINQEKTPEQMILDLMDHITN